MSQSAGSAIGGDPTSARRRIRVVAILAAYNEADIIATVVGHLVDQGVDVYFIDNGSTDGTLAAVEPWIGKGVIGTEHFPGTPSPDGEIPLFNWESILRRKEAIAREIDADWFIHHDADEFRESPWRDRSLVEAIELVDRAGYNAVDFAVLNFWPTHDDFRAGDDVRTAFHHFQFGEHYDRVQIKCWKKTTEAVDLASVGGHDVVFPGRRIFPIRFVLRHYPIRGQSHGERKVFSERRTRFDPAERARGWHVQYDAISEGQNFIRSADSLVLYDPDMVRLNLLLEHRTVEALRDTASVQREELERVGTERDHLTEEAAAVAAHVALLVHGRDEATGTVAELRAEVSGLEQGRKSSDVTIATLRADVDRLEQLRESAHATALELRAEVDHLDQRCQAAEATIAALRAEVGRVEALRQLADGAAAALRGEVSRLEQAHVEATGALEQLRVALASEQAATLQATQDATARAAEIASLRRSMSWRITRPVRWSYDTMRRILGLPPV